MKRKLILIFIFLLVYTISGETLKDHMRYLPQIENLNKEGEAAYYNSSNLWEYINGAAPGYIAYGFKEVVNFVLISEDGQHEFVIDIFDMNDSLNAFGIFSIETSIGERDQYYGCGSFRTRNMIYFWQDQFYIKIMSYDETGQSQSYSDIIARQVSKILPDKGQLPAIFTFFPTKDRIKNSEKYAKKDILGQNYLSNGFSASYLSDETPYEIYIIEMSNEGEAEEKLKKYQKFLESNGNILILNPLKTKSSFLGKDNYYGNILAASQKNYIGLILGNIKKQTSISIIQDIFQKFE